jgi:sterol desaturase/sphingolipid hydroxylase (fatty acid hydroxylase superfamily)
MHAAGSNQVFAAQARKARGALYFAPWDRRAIGAAGALGLWLAGTVHLMLGLGLFVASVVAVHLHRRLDHDRLDHLELLGRRLLRPPTWNHCERDLAFRRPPWR